MDRHHQVPQGAEIPDLGGLGEVLIVVERLETQIDQ
jgi:hypothetical protein